MTIKFYGFHPFYGKNCRWVYFLGPSDVIYVVSPYREEDDDKLQIRKAGSQQISDYEPVNLKKILKYRYIKIGKL